MKSILPGSLRFEELSISDIRSRRISDLLAGPKKKKVHAKKPTSVLDLLSPEQLELWKLALREKSFRKS